METTLSKVNGQTKATAMTKDDINSLVQAGIIPQGTPESQIKIFASVCREKNLSPFSKQIHLIKRGDKYTIQTAVDGFRVIAERTGAYAGSTDYTFNEGLTQYEMIQAGHKTPETATVTVKKIVSGVVCEFTSTAQWSAYFPGEKLGFMWTKMPFLMLGKCAESLALRKAFPESLTGIYSTEEMHQAEVIADHEVKIETNHAEVSGLIKHEIETFNDYDLLIQYAKGQTALHKNEEFRTLVKNRIDEIKKGVAL